MNLGWLVHGEENVFRGGVREIRVGGGSGEFRDDGLQLSPVVARVVYVEVVVALVVRMKRKPEQSGFSAGSEPRSSGDVQEGRRGARAVTLDNLNVPALFDNKEAAAVVVGLLHIEWRGKTRCDGN